MTTSTSSLAERVPRRLSKLERASGSGREAEVDGPAAELAQPEGRLPRNFLRPCVLLLLQEGSAHGYDLLDRLAEFGFHRGDPGGLYRVLRSMEKEGLLSSHWETSDIGPARRTYMPTDEGRDWLHAWAGALSESRRRLTTFLARYDRATTLLPRG